MTSSPVPQRRSDDRRFRTVATLALGLALATAALLAALVLARDVVLSVFGLATILLPALALSWSLRRGDRANWLDVVPWVALGIGFVAVTGLALNELPFGLNRWSWLGAGALMLIVAWRLGRGRPGGRPLIVRPVGLSAWGWVTLIGAIGVTVLALTVARLGVVVPPEPISQLWMVASPTGGNAREVGIRNDEGRPMDYRLDILVDGTVIDSHPAIQLQPGDRWTAEFEAAVPAGSQLEALLYRATHPDTVYRRVVIRTPSGAATEPSAAATEPSAGAP